MTRRKRLLAVGIVLVSMAVVDHWAPGRTVWMTRTHAQGTIACTQSVIEAAEAALYNNGAGPGGTINIGAGTCDWNSMWVYPNTTLQGGVGGTTTITSTGGSAFGLGWLGQDNQRVTGFTFNCQQSYTHGGKNWRLDHNIWNACSPDPTQIQRNMVFNMVGDPTHLLQGLFDHNTLNNVSPIAYGYPSDGPSSPSEWNTFAAEGTAPLDLGGPTAVYVEDNTFNFTRFLNAIDCEIMGAYVFRHNFVDGVYPEAHSARAYTRGCKKWEVYNNDYVATVVQPSFLGFFRGGSGVVFNERYVGVNVSNIVFDNVRSYETLRGNGNLGDTDSAPHAMCWGNTGANAGVSSPFDGNTDADGYPCLDQIGRGHDTTPQVNPYPPYGPTQTQIDSVYVWNNVKYATIADRNANVNGTVQGVTINQAWAGGDCPRCGRIIQANRDYYVNVGAKPGYTPYTYPHPLQNATSSGLPRPATGVIVTP